jgi:hypothetical protein
MLPGPAPFTRRSLFGALPLLGLTACTAAPAPPPAVAARGEAESDRLARLVAAYPDHLRTIEGVDLVWADGTRMPTGAGLPARPFETMLRDATIADQLRQAYAPGPLAAPPPRDHSPGRIRNAAFFRRMYGDCRDPRAAPRITRVTWMPRTRPQPVSVTTVNDVAGRLMRVTEALEGLPDRLKAWLVPSAGAYNCRDVADSGLPSMHASGAAIDIGIRGSDYWAWSRARGEIPYRNRIPQEIVDAFEAERFIWGGKWHHYDTMHFEYRPELFG